MVGMAVMVLLSVCANANAQIKGEGDIPAEYYYLMPSFGQGYIYLKGQMPAQGQLNICAVDNSLRYLDKGGKELQATNTENVVKVLIDTVTFLHHQDAYYRLSPVAPDMGVAVLRKVTIITDGKEIGYGITSQTTSSKSYTTLYADGAIYSLEESKKYPYEVTETLFLYKGDAIYPLSKKNFRKLFPDKKDQIDAYFKEGHSVPQTLPEARDLVASFMAE